MAEYVDREEAKAWIDDWLRNDKYWHPYSKGKNIPTAEVFEMLSLIHAAADVVEVVRCKDCIHRPSRIPGASDDHEGLNLEFPDDWCPMQCEDGWYNRMPGDDFFCGYGERKEKSNG